MKLLVAGCRGELFVDAIHRRDHTREIRDLGMGEKKGAVLEDLEGRNTRDEHE